MFLTGRNIVLMSFVVVTILSRCECDGLAVRSSRGEGPYTTHEEEEVDGHGRLKSIVGAETTSSDPIHQEHHGSTQRGRRRAEAIGGQLLQAEVDTYFFGESYVTSNHAGYTGPGYVDMRSGTGSSVRWINVMVDTTGQYDIKLRYANGDDEGRPCRLLVSRSHIGNMAFAPTGEWDSWEVETMEDVWISADVDNVIRVKALGQGPLLDSVEIVNRSQQQQQSVTYMPGDLTKTENGLLLSTGLTSKIIAVAGQPVGYHDGSSSIENFHHNPDGGATFAQPDGDGWVYVSSSELLDGNGGVGAITFDSDGNMVKYEMLLNGTTRNCSGGKTPWNTFVSCEETLGGKIYEVDPFGGEIFQQTDASWQQTSMADEHTAGRFESVACDNRNPERPDFYVTKDEPDGELRRFRPSDAAMDDAIMTGDYSQVLSTEGKMDYLVLQPNSADGEQSGTYYWTSDIDEGKASAEDYFKLCEGIAFNEQDGILLFVSKIQKEVFALSLDSDTYEKSSTEVGMFDGTPDQITLLLTADDHFMWFLTEEAGTAGKGIFGRDHQGNYFQIIRLNDYSGETAGISFSPDLKHLYFAAYMDGIIFDITREDGREFGDESLPLTR